MKKLFVFILILFFNSSYCQSIDYNKITSVLQAKFPEINFNNKLLTITVWSSSDAESREMNKEMLKTYKTYQGARLSGGLKGMIFISISTDNQEVNYTIATKKDLDNYEYVLCDFNSFEKIGLLSELGIDSSVKNMVFNTSGTQLFKNIETNQIFITFNKLTTR